jgi:hypothetical protein
MLQNKSHIFVLAVTLLAVGMFVQAVHAKNSDYFPSSQQSVRFSTTVKIADLAHHVAAYPGAVTVLRGVLPLTRPQSTRTSYAPVLPVQELSQQFSFRPLRSPPVNL